jgi:hypothetical protein
MVEFWGKKKEKKKREDEITVLTNLMECLSIVFFPLEYLLKNLHKPDFLN